MGTDESRLGPLCALCAERDDSPTPLSFPEGRSVIVKASVMGNKVTLTVAEEQMIGDEKGRK